MIAAVRRFNRAVTQRAGALDDAFLARGRPLGQARVLWEIGPDGRDVRDLRARLDLDSGYLSRLLRGLERDGLVTVEVNEADGRIRTARLTAAGEAERAELDRLSDDAAASLLGPLSDRQRGRLVTAMAEVERLLTASAIAATSRVRWPALSGSRIAAAASSERRSSSSRSASPRPVRQAVRTRPSARLCSTTMSPSSSSDRSSRLRYPESRSSPERSSRTSRPAGPISHSRRACPSGRPRARNASLSAPIRWVTVRLNLRTCSTMPESIL